MLKKLQSVIKKKGLVLVTSELGYRSLNTVNNWIKKNKIPASAEQRVRKYLTVN